LAKIVKNSFYRENLIEFSKSEKIGKPVEVISVEVDSAKFDVSATTLRYINNLFNMESLFCGLFTGVSVYEIGGGYGGEAKIYNDLGKLRDKNYSKWTIFDLPTSEALIKRFNSFFGYECNFMNVFEDRIENEAEYLVVSNGAFSEMRSELQEKYFDCVIKNAKYGYFHTNFESHSAPFGGWTTAEFIRKLKSHGKHVQVLSPRKYLSIFDERVGGKLIVFGVDGKLPQENSIRQFYLHFQYAMKCRLLNNKRVRNDKNNSND
jgi:hypothetical protein